MSFSVPTVTVVIPCYNLGAYLDQAVQSVLDQTFKDFEIIIIDDGSTDPATRHLFTSYQRPRTRIIRTENRGLAEARNLGIREARGRYISCLDADDLFEPTFLQRTVEVLESDRSVAFASCWLKAFGETEFLWNPNTCEFPHLLAEDTVCTAALTRKEALLQVGGFDSFMPVAGYEDWDLAISLVERGLRGTIIPEYLFRYRIRFRSGSMSSSCCHPDNHARLMRYIVEKHAESYRQHFKGVIETIEKRTLELEGYQAHPSIGRSREQSDHVAFLETLLHGVLESRNWRFTRPLRQAYHCLKSFGLRLCSRKRPLARLSAIVTCRDQGEELSKALETFRHQIGSEDEIVIVDDGSTDPMTRQVLEWYQEAGFRIVRTAGVGFVKARAAGLGYARASIVFAIDADQTLEAGCLQRAIGVLEDHPDFSFVSCGLRDELTGYTWLPESTSLPSLLGCPRLTFPIVRRAALFGSGGYDEDLENTLQADWALAIQLAARGCKGLLLPEPLVNHPATRRIREDGSARRDTRFELMRAVIHRHRELFEHHWMQVVLEQENQRRRLQAWIEDAKPTAEPSQVKVDWGGLRRLEPISQVWGIDRGKPIDRYYIEEFLDQHRGDIHGRVLEVKDPNYTHTFGEGVETSDVVDIARDNPSATLVCDLAACDSLPESTYDCFILTQTIHMIYDMGRVIENAARALRPGGVLLATLPCTSRIDYESGLERDCWRYTPSAVRKLFEKEFGAGRVEVKAFGNVLTSCGFLMGIAAEELSPEELGHHDPYFPLVACVRAVKTEPAGVAIPTTLPTKQETAPNLIEPASDFRLMAEDHQIESFSCSPTGIVFGASNPTSEIATTYAPHDSFRVIAIIAAYNEGDIISKIISHLAKDGIEVYLIDNRSTDDTVEQASQWLGRGLIDIELFPKDLRSNPRASEGFDWTAILRRKEELANELSAAWFIHHDADEIRESPLPGLGLKQAIHMVDKLGYNCIDFRVFNFRPLDDGFQQGDDPRSYFTHYEDASEFDQTQLKCWKAKGTPISLAPSGGHEAQFQERRIFPIPFILRHYPIRGQKHGLKKVFVERKNRFLEEERSWGWHVQYDGIVDEAHCFIWEPKTLRPFDLDQARQELQRHMLDLLLSRESEVSDLMGCQSTHRLRKPDQNRAEKQCETENSNGAIIFYHRAASLVPDTHELCVSANDFRDHMKHLREHYHPMSLEEFTAASAAASLPTGAVAVTLDDGYLNSLTTVSPILLEFGIPAAFFINTEQFDDEHECWWDVIERIFSSEHAIPPILDLYDDGGWVRQTQTKEEKAETHAALVEMMYPMSLAERDAIVRRLTTWSDMDLSPRSTHRPMTADEVLELAARKGHTIGAHTTHHLSLPFQPEEVQRREIIENKNCLERLLGRPITAFSYPYGAYHKQTVSIVRDASFQVAVTVEKRPVRLGAQPLLLPRFEIKGCGLNDFAKHLRTIFDT